MKKIKYFLYCYFYYFITLEKNQMDTSNPKKSHDIMDDKGAYVGKRLYLTEKDDFIQQKNKFVSEQSPQSSQSSQSPQSSQSSVVELKSLTK